MAFRFELWAQCERALREFLDAARRLTARRRTQAKPGLARLEVQGTAAVAALAAVRAGRPATPWCTWSQPRARCWPRRPGSRPRSGVGLADVVRATELIGGPLVYWAATLVGGLALVVRADGSVVAVEIGELASRSGRLRCSTACARRSRAPARPPTTRSPAGTRRSGPWCGTPGSWPWRTWPIADAEAVGLVPIGRLTGLPLAAALDRAVVDGVVPGLRCVPRTLPNARTLPEPPPWRTVRVAVLADPGPPDRTLTRVTDEAAAVAATYASPVGPPVAVAAETGRARTLRRGQVPTPPGGSAEALLARIGDADVAHLAGHFDLDPDRPTESVLWLCGGVELGALLQARFAGRRTWCSAPATRG